MSGSIETEVFANSRFGDLDVGVMNPTHLEGDYLQRLEVAGAGECPVSSRGWKAPATSASTQCCKEGTAPFKVMIPCISRIPHEQIRVCVACLGTLGHSWQMVLAVRSIQSWTVVNGQLAKSS
jgi:hypothetical protein